MKKPSIKEIDDLYTTILKLESVDECRRFFGDLLTEYEVKEFVKRWKVATLHFIRIKYASNQWKNENSNSTERTSHR